MAIMFILALIGGGVAGVFGVEAMTVSPQNIMQQIYVALTLVGAMLGLVVLAVSVGAAQVVRAIERTKKSERTAITNAGV